MEQQRSSTTGAKSSALPLATATGIALPSGLATISLLSAAWAAQEKNAALGLTMAFGAVLVALLLVLLVAPKAPASVRWLALLSGPVALALIVELI